MQLFHGQNADEAWLAAAESFRRSQDTRECASRAGGTSELLHAGFSVDEPQQRWVFSRNPALNPAFAIAEVFWILAGRNDAAFLTPWNRQLPNYAGTGPTFHGAYGYRLRVSVGFDQISAAYEALRHNAETRQVVLQIWSPKDDFPDRDGRPRSADIPCNICAFLKVRGCRLHWLQVLRSNDLVLGGAVQFHPVH